MAGLRARINHFLGERAYILLLYLLTIVLIISSKMISPSFGTWQQAESIAVISSMLIFVGFGQGIAILIGELDLSVGSVISLAGVLTASWWGGELGSSSVIYIILILIAVGLINGFGVAFLKIPSFIMTLAMQMIIFGCALGYTKGTVPGSAPLFLENLMTNRWGGMPAMVWMLIFMMLLGLIIQKHTRLGRKLYAVGSNRTTAYLTGIPVKWIIVIAYIVSALCAGITGILLVAYSGGASLAMGEPYLLPSIAMVVIGGSSILGGSGSYLGTVGAALLLTTISTLIQALGISQGWQTFIYGLMILFVLGFLRKDFYQLFSKLKLGRVVVNGNK